MNSQLIETLESRRLLDGTVNTFFGASIYEGSSESGFNNGIEFMTDVATFADGRIAVAGTYRRGASRPVPAVVMYDHTGNQDDRFDEDGTILLTGLPIAASQHVAHVAIAADADGRLLLAISAPSDGSANSTTIVRLKGSGRLDTSFGDSGRATLEVDPREIVLQRDGKILVAGVGLRDGATGFAVARLNVNGLPDQSFGDNGIATHAGDAGVAFVPTEAIALAVERDGDIVAVGSADNAGDVAGFVTRFDRHGRVDDSFGINGRATILDVAGTDDSAGAVALADDGKVLVLVRTDHVYQLNANGSIDRTFGKNGKFVFGHESVPRISRADMVRQPDGRILVGGLSRNEGQVFSGATVYRYSAQGQQDTKFGRRADGIGDLIGGPRQGPKKLALAADGSLVLAGDRGVLPNRKPEYIDGFAITEMRVNSDPLVYLETARDITRPTSAAMSIELTLRDQQGIKPSFFDNRDLRITGPNGFVRYAKFSSYDFSGEFNPDRGTQEDSRYTFAFYKLTAPGGSWDAADNGTYTITLRDQAVGDSSNNLARGRVLGSFEVRIA